jgi:hypothetical protein
VFDVNLNKVNKNKYQLFSDELNKALRLKYSAKKISALYFARQYNLECKKASLHISQESARKWLKGLSFPSQERLMVLILWLKLDSRFFYIEDIEQSHLDNSRQAMLAIKAKNLKDTLIKMSSELLELIKKI